MRLADKVAVVTGGGTGLGKAICLRFSKEGAKVLVADAEDSPGLAVVEAILEGGGEATFAKVDFSDEAEIQAMVADAIVSYGTLDALVNGATLRLDGDPLGLTREEWKKSLAVNLECAWLCARYSAPFLKTGGGGSIVHVAPTDVLRTMPRSFPYAVSKGGLLAMSRSLAIDLGSQGIRSNVLITGYIQTDEEEARLQETSDPEDSFRRILSTHPMGRAGTPDDVARAVTFLASPDAAFISGTTLVVDGGRSAAIQDLHNW